MLPWDPSLYLKGLHTIQVKVEVSGGRAPALSPQRMDVCFVFSSSLQDSAGRSSVREQQFTLEDDLIPGFGVVQSFLLLTDHYILGRAAFVFAILVNVGGLMAFRFLRLSVNRGEPPPLLPLALLIGSDLDILFLR